MFDFDAGKLIVIGIVALIVIGPKELPRVLRQVGQAIGKMRRIAGDFQGQFMDAMREADLEDIRKDVAKMADSAKVDVNFDPVHTMRHEIGGAIDGTASQAVLSPEDPDRGVTSLNMAGLSSVEQQAASGADSAGEQFSTGIGPVTPEAVEASGADASPAPTSAPVAQAAIPTPAQQPAPVPSHAAARSGEA